MATTYEPIATTTLGSAAASITFSSIASSWTDLVIIWNPQSESTNSYPTINFNNDTSTNYSYTTLFGTGSTASSQRGSNNSTAFLTSSASTITTQPQLLKINIFNYTGSTYKSFLSEYSGDNNGTGIVSNVVNLWRSTSAITSIKLQMLSGNLAAGSTATLYGIKNA